MSDTFEFEYQGRQCSFNAWSGSWVKLEEDGKNPELYRYSLGTGIRALMSRNAALEAELAAHKASAPLCDEHAPNGGTRCGCPYCGITRLYMALSRIDYALEGKFNDMGVSDFDIHCNEDAVVERAIAAAKELAAAKADYQKIIAEVLQCNPIPACKRDDDQLEPPWEVIARIRTEVEALRKQLAEARDTLVRLRERVEDSM